VPEPEPLVIEDVTPAMPTDLPTGPDLEPETPAAAPRASAVTPPHPPAPAPARTTPLHTAPSAPARSRPPIAMIAGAVVVVAGLGVGAMMLMRGRGGTPTPADQPLQPGPSAAAPRADSAPAGTTDSAAAAATAMGFVRVIGDLPDDAVIWLDTMRLQGRVAQIAPGRYNLEVETTEFQPWERRITVRTGDTTRVLVELELLETDTTQSP
jgi:hypothetical protein